jgi:DNA polymerase-3 subunit gamma/tau
MSYQVLARKWRPQNFPELVGQQQVLQGLVHSLEQQRLHHAYLFTGSRGVGKTTVARILAKCLNCEVGVTANPCGTCQPCQEITAGRFLDLIEIDAASRTKVEDTREILDNVQYAPTRGRYKIYLIDEVHMLSGHSFNALLKTLEEPPPHVKFLLATTDPQKLPVTVLSRCLQYHLKNIDPQDIAKQMAYILEQENISSEAQALTLLSRAANGSMRDGLSLLDQAIAFGQGSVTEAATREMLGSTEHQDIFAIIDALAANNAQALLAAAQALSEKGADFTEVLAALSRLLNQMALTQVIANPYTQEFSAEKVQALAKQFTAQHIQLLYQISIIAKRDLPLAPDARTGFEMSLLRLLAFQPSSLGVSSPAPAFAKATAGKPVQQQPTMVNPTPVQTIPAVQLTPETWRDVLGQLTLNGVAKQLAQHCVLTSYEAGVIKLAVDAQHAHLLNDRLKQTITTALQMYLGQPIKVQIESAQQAVHTPAHAVQQERNEQQRQAEGAIESDLFVQAMQSQLGAQVEPNSIKPV